MKFANFLKIFLKILVKIQLKKVIIYKSILENSKKDEPLKADAVNLATFTNALCHCNATPLSVAVLTPCAWGENLVCGGAWQGVINSAKHNTAWRCEFDNETAKRGDTANSARGQWSNACRRSGQSENGAVFAWGPSLSLSLSR